MKRILLNFTIVISLILLFSANSRIMAVTAYPHPVEIKQPDGTTITVLLKGDEKIRWAETTDGYTVLYNSEGIFEYAVLDNKGDLILSGIKAKDETKRSKTDDDFLAKTTKGLYFSDSQVSIMKSIWEIKASESQKAFPTTGNRKLICILMGFKDVSFTKSQSDFNNLFNQVNYSTGGATGSVKDFYLESSYDQFNLQVDVVGPYTAANNMSYYGANDSYGNDANPRALVTEAVNAADASVNFANYDNDNDGSVDGVYVIYAGYGEEAGASANAIWAHAWNITTVYKDGVSISKYSCSAELRGNSGTTITSIGVICHEFGHVLGAPDYYDTNYSTGGQFDGTGKWDLMASGSWNNSGITPAQHNAYTKIYYYNWAQATLLSSASNISVTNSVDNKSFYRINSTTSGEFWLIENRQQIGFDAQIPGHGLLIYHVHSGIGSVGNAINATYPQRMYPVCASATTNPGTTASTYGTINSGGCPFPGTSNKTSFTDNTTPNMKSWAGANTSKPITNISENSTTKTVSFAFMGGGSTDTQAPTAPGSLSSSNISQTSVTLSWTASTDNVGVTGYDIYRNNALLTSTTGTSYNVTGLTASTTYSFYVKAKDAAGNISAASNTINVTTLNIIATYCTSKGNNSSYEWIAKVQLGSYTKSSGAAGYTDFTSENITLQAGSSLAVTLTPGFASSTYNEYWKIWIDYNNNKEFETNELVFDAGALSKTAVSGTISIPASANGTTRIRVSMKYNAAQTACETFSYGEVEDYTVTFGQATPDTQAPTAPTGLASSNVTQTSLTLSWNASSDNVGVTGYDVYRNGSLLGSVTSTSANVTGLAAATSYSFYVKAKDAAGNVSAASSTINVTTLSEQLTYCISKGNNASYEWIDLVQLNEINNATGNNGGYANFTSKVANVALGSTQTIYISCGFKSSSYTEYWHVWIDWDHSGTFDSDELMVSGSSSSSATLSATFTVPSDAVLGATRMRVTMKYNAAATSCETFSYGEVEDYTVNVNSASYNDYFASSPLNDQTLGNEESTNIMVYPNPADSYINVSITNGIKTGTISIYNIVGSLVKSIDIDGNEKEINVSELPAGSYLISVDDERESIVKTFIKK